MGTTINSNNNESFLYNNIEDIANIIEWKTDQEKDNRSKKYAWIGTSLGDSDKPHILLVKKNNLIERFIASIKWFLGLVQELPSNSTLLTSKKIEIIKSFSDTENTEELENFLASNLSYDKLYAAEKIHEIFLTINPNISKKSLKEKIAIFQETENSFNKTFIKNQKQELKSKIQSTYPNFSPITLKSFFDNQTLFPELQESYNKVILDKEAIQIISRLKNYHECKERVDTLLKFAKKELGKNFTMYYANRNSFYRNITQCTDEHAKKEEEFIHIIKFLIEKKDSRIDSELKERLILDCNILGKRDFKEKIEKIYEIEIKKLLIKLFEKDNKATINAEAFKDSFLEKIHLLCLEQLGLDQKKIDGYLVLRKAIVEQFKKYTENYSKWGEKLPAIENQKYFPVQLALLNDELKTLQINKVKTAICEKLLENFEKYSNNNILKTEEWDSFLKKFSIETTKINYDSITKIMKSKKIKFLKSFGKYLSKELAQGFGANNDGSLDDKAQEALVDGVCYAKSRTIAIESINSPNKKLEDLESINKITDQDRILQAKYQIRGTLSKAGEDFQTMTSDQLKALGLSNYSEVSVLPFTITNSKNKISSFFSTLFEKQNSLKDGNEGWFFITLTSEKDGAHAISIRLSSNPKSYALFDPNIGLFDFSSLSDEEGKNNLYNCIESLVENYYSSTKGLRATQFQKVTKITQKTSKNLK